MLPLGGSVPCEPMGGTVWASAFSGGYHPFFGPRQPDQLPNVLGQEPRTGGPRAAPGGVPSMGVFISSAVPKGGSWLPPQRQIFRWSPGGSPTLVMCMATFWCHTSNHCMGPRGPPSLVSAWQPLGALPPISGPPTCRLRLATGGFPPPSLCDNQLVPHPSTL